MDVLICRDFYLKKCLIAQDFLYIEIIMNKIA